MSMTNELYVQYNTRYDDKLFGDFMCQLVQNQIVQISSYISKMFEKLMSKLINILFLTQNVN